MSGFERKLRVLIVDDHPLIRDGVAALLAGNQHMELVGEADSVVTAVQQFNALRPDVTLMDLQLAGGSGIEAIAAIRREDPKARILVLTTFAGDVRAKRALKAGAQGYLLKDKVRTELTREIRAVAQGSRTIDRDIAMQLAQHASDDVMSMREIQVLELVAKGKSNKQVADALTITEGTVKNHVKTIMSKLQATDRTHAVVVAMARGIINGGQ